MSLPIITSVNHLTHSSPGNPQLIEALPQAKSQKTCNQTFLSTASNSVECVSMAASPKELKLLLNYIYFIYMNDIPKKSSLYAPVYM